MRVLHLWRPLPFSLTAVLVWLVPAGLAQAQGPAGTTLELVLPPESAVGRETEVSARLANQSGFAVAGAQVVFQREVEFMNASRDLPLGEAVTDAQGVATISFVPRSEGDLVVFALFDGNSRYGFATADGSVPIDTGPALYTEEAGVQAPGVNVSLLVALLGGVWSIFFVVMVLIWLIAREGAVPELDSGGRRE